MIKEITFITGNEKKFNNAKAFFRDTGIELLREKIDTPEIQGNSIVEVAEYSAKYAGELLNKAVIKVDVGFFIEGLGGFPGPYIKYINEWLKLEQLLNLCGDLEDRTAYFEDVVSCYIPNVGVKSFSTKTYGVLADKPSGDNGWGIDKIFIPNGYKTTLASMNNEDQSKVWSAERWIKMVTYLSGLN